MISKRFFVFICVTFRQTFKNSSRILNDLQNILVNRVVKGGLRNKCTCRCRRLRNDLLPHSCGDGKSGGDVGLLPQRYSNREAAICRCFKIIRFLPASHASEAATVQNRAVSLAPIPYPQIGLTNERGAAIPDFLRWGGPFFPSVSDIPSARRLVLRRRYQGKSPACRRTRRSSTIGANLRP